MKKSLIFLSLYCSSLWAGSSCFLVYENQDLLKREGSECSQRFSPESTFKIALSLMGYDSGILKDESHPLWPFKEGYDLFINVWKDPHNPRTWIRDSCVWYSQVLTQKLGMKAFKDYVVSFNYGNKDLSGDRGQNNGLTHAWLSSSLAISPEEQIRFMQTILDRTLPLKSKAYDMSKKILFIQELAGGWRLYGKTGNGKLLNPDGSRKKLQHGWFVGWIEKNGRKISFVEHVKDDREQGVFASFRAKNDVLNKLFYIINDLERP